MTWFRRGEIVEKATREMSDVISINIIDAKSTKTSGTVTVSGKGMKFSARTAVRGVALA